MASRRLQGPPRASSGAVRAGSERVGAVRVYLLGTPRIEAGDAEARALERHDALMLALLAVEGPMGRVRLARLLWPRSASGDATGSLRQRIHRLAVMAGQPVVVGAAELSLSPGVWHDVTPEYACSDQGMHCLHSDLLDTLACGGEPDLADWLDMARRRWRDWRDLRLAELAQHSEDVGDFERALHWAERLRAQSPSIESTHQRVMRVHYLRGDRAAALKVYQECAACLQRDLRVTPGEATEALRRTIERVAPPVAQALSSELALRRPPRLVDRQTELDAAMHAIQAGQPVLVEGEPGIGKSRLLGEIAARTEGRSLTVGARAGDDARPYALLARFFEALLERFGLPTEPSWVAAEVSRVLPRMGSSRTPGDRPQLDAASAACLAHAVGQGVSLMVIDDLQFADKHSLRTLFAQVQAGGRPGWLLGMRRGGTPGELAQWIRSPAGSSLSRLSLTGLSRTGMLDLVRSLDVEDSWADPLWLHTGGHPLFALQTLLACTPAQRSRGPEGSLPVPVQLGQLIDSRLQGLSAAALRLAQLAALSGEVFSVPLAAAVLGVHALDLAGPWRELEEAQLVRETTFAHDLMRDAALRTMPQPIAAELHRQIARQAAVLGLSSQICAHHLERAGEVGEAATAYARAAREAGQRGDWSAALQWWDQAAHNHTKAADMPAAWGAARAAAAIAQEITSDDDATRRLEVLLAAAVDEAQRGQAQILKARHAVAHARFDEAELAAREALARAAALTPAQIVEAAGFYGLSLATLKRHPEALAVFEQHRDAASRLQEPWTRSEFLSAQGHALAQADQLRAAVAAWRGAADGALQAGRVGDAIVNLHNASGTANFLGQSALALQLADRAQDLRRSMASGHSLVHAAATMQRGTLHIALGRYAEAHESLEQALREWTTDGVKTWRVVAENSLAYLYWVLGQHARARQALTTPLVAGEPGFARRQVVSARLQLHPRDALRSGLQAALDRPAPTDRGVNRFGVQLALADLLPQPGRAAALGAIIQEAGAREHLSIVLHARIRRADALRLEGDATAAADEARQAVALRDTMCMPHDMYLGEFWWLTHLALRAAGDAVGADQALVQGENWVLEKALPNVNAPFRDSFLHRNSINSLLLSAAQRLRRG